MRRSRPPAGARPRGMRWPGARSAARTWARSCSCLRGCTRPRGPCCWCSPPVRVYPRTSAPPSARSVSCAASGWMAPGVSRGSKTTLRLSPRRGRARRHAVGVGGVPRRGEGPAVVTAVARAGANDVVARLNAGLDTQLGATWPGGVEVSFGQWQKLALARGFMRDEPLLLVLDEPTAALDAETEHALFERYAAAAQGTDADGHITLLVSHRFSTVRIADLIVVLDGARVVDVGPHDELLSRRRACTRPQRVPAA